MRWARRSRFVRLLLCRPPDLPRHFSDESVPKEVEEAYIARQGNIGTTFKKIIMRAGIIPWEKLIHNLRASFETDLLNGKYGHFGLQTIAAWLGHSVPVMLKHYGRIQKADYDKIAQTSQEVKERKKQAKTQENGMASVSLIFSQGQVAQKASQYTAADGEIGGNGAESAFLPHLTQTLEPQHLTARKEIRGNLAEPPQNLTSGGQGSRTLNRLPGN